MAGFWEPEEAVGTLWHRMVGGGASIRGHPEAAVTFAEIRPRLALIFRALGGAGAVRMAAGNAEPSRHRQPLIRRIGLGGDEKLGRPRFDGSVLHLPERLDMFGDRADNAALYEWLVAFFALAPPWSPLPDDPLQADLMRLRYARRAVALTLAAWPGLAGTYGRLSAAVCSLRPVRRLPPQEAAVEVLIQNMLGAAAAPDPALTAVVADDAAGLHHLQAAPQYQPFLPVPLWGETVPPPLGGATEDGATEGGVGLAGDAKRRRARRRRTDQIRRKDPLMLNRFEKILGLAEMADRNRKTEDDDPESARKAADDLDEIAIGSHEHRPATRLALDLDIAVADADTAPVIADTTYPEWDWKRRAYLPDHCRVVVGPAAAEGEDWQPDAVTLRRMRLVRRQFEALRPQRQIMPAQADGDDLDLSALVRAVADRRAGGPGSDRVYSAVRKVARDLSVCLLVDVSMSTDAWIEDRRVLDVTKEALLVLTHGLSASNDEHAILTFTSRRRHRVDVRWVKHFDERLSPAVTRRIQALRPGDYTRMGAAVRHATSQLERRPHRHRLLLLLTDGKPNDADHYEGRYAIEDTHVAVQEARRAGLKVFAVTVDAKGQDYLPYLFGPTAYAVFPHIARLPAALPAIYRQLTA